MNKSVKRELAALQKLSRYIHAERLIAEKTKKIWLFKKNVLFLWRYFDY